MICHSNLSKKLNTHSLLWKQKWNKYHCDVTPVVAQHLLPVVLVWEQNVLMKHLVLSRLLKS